MTKIKNFLKYTLTKPLLLITIIAITLASTYMLKPSVNPMTVVLTDKNNNKTTLKNYINNKPVIINFWASWCEHCQNEVSIFNTFYSKHRDIKLITIQVDDNYSQAFKKAKYPIFHAPKYGNAMMSSFGNSTGALPYTIFLDENSKVKEAILGEATLDDLETSLTKIK